jgi:hypothetical protein
MEGYVLSFLKAEWKVSDTGSAHWASCFILTDIINSLYFFYELLSDLVIIV